MYWVMVLFASIGAALILGALTFVSALIGGIINAMIVLMCGPLIDRMIAVPDETDELLCHAAITMADKVARHLG